MNDSSDDDEVKLVMKMFCKLLRKKEKVEDGPVCYGCGEARHIKNKCPRSGRNARHFKKQRAYISWGGDSGDESSEQEEDEEANLCLIAQEEEESANDENQEAQVEYLVKEVAKLTKFKLSMTNVTIRRRRENKSPVTSWNKMRALVKKKFLRENYIRENFSKLQHLKQGSRSVEEYNREFEELLLRNFGYSPYQDSDGDNYYEPHGDQDDYDQSGPMCDDQSDPLVEEIIRLEQKIFYFDEVLFAEGSWYEPPYSRDYTLFAEEQIEANKVAIRERAKFLESVRKEKEFKRRLCKGSEMIQKMLDEFQRERLEAEAKTDELVNDLCKAIGLKRSLQSQDQMREVNAQNEALEPKTNPKPFNYQVLVLKDSPSFSPSQKPESITTLARATVVMLPEYTPPEEPVLEEIEPITCPQDTNVQESEQEFTGEEILCIEKPTPSIETCVRNASSEDSDQTFFDSLHDGCDDVCLMDGWSLRSWDELLMSDTENSSMGESTVVIIKPQMDGQPVEDKEKINLAVKANDVDQLRRLPPPPTYLEYPPFILLPPSRKDESRILDLDRATIQTGWHQKRVKRAKLYDSRIGKSRKKWVSVELWTLKKRLTRGNPSFK
ncbi:unnamed protein product [Cuscuta campestris]|uniref:CCHC-type domain-containing protein n=1 Tax=Cuscuta campestris TaxID=132261 RepID=A0A484N879_9ASTE|nr:unnamed protein product [Cuscuta campestris]